MIVIDRDEKNRWCVTPCFGKRWLKTRYATSATLDDVIADASKELEATFGKSNSYLRRVK